MSHFSRRNFLRSSAAGSAVLTFGRLAPSALQAAAEQSKSERILVVIELQGGNDGLNTVIPVGDETYRKLRSKLAIAKNDSLEISDGLAFHSSLRGFADLLEAGRLAVIQGVGYPDPNRSHFESMDIWHTCQRKDENRTDGWLGRLLEQTPDAGVGDPSACILDMTSSRSRSCHARCVYHRFDRWNSFICRAPKTLSSARPCRN